MSVKDFYLFLNLLNFMINIFILLFCAIWFNLTVCCGQFALLKFTILICDNLNIHALRNIKIYSIFEKKKKLAIRHMLVCNKWHSMSVSYILD